MMPENILNIRDPFHCPHLQLNATSPVQQQDRDVNIEYTKQASQCSGH